MAHYWDVLSKIILKRLCLDLIREEKLAAIFEGAYYLEKVDVRP